MRHLEKERFYLSYFWILEDNYRDRIDGRGGVGNMKTQLLPHKVPFRIERQDGVLFHLRIIKNYHPWRRHSVRIIKLLFWVVFYSVLTMVTVKVVWVIGPPTLPTKKLFVVLMVMT